MAHTHGRTRVGDEQEVQWETAATEPGPNSYMRLLVKETETLYKVLSKYLNAGVLQVRSFPFVVLGGWVVRALRSVSGSVPPRPSETIRGLARSALLALPWRVGLRYRGIVMHCGVIPMAWQATQVVCASAERGRRGQ